MGNVKRATTLPTAIDEKTTPATAPSTPGKDPAADIIKQFDAANLRLLHQAAHRLEARGPEEFLKVIGPLVLELWNKPSYQALEPAMRQKAVANAIGAKHSMKKEVTESIRVTILSGDPIQKADSPADAYMKFYAICPAEKMAFTIMAKTTGIEALKKVKDNQSVLITGVSVSRNERMIYATKGEITVNDIKDEKPTLAQVMDCVEKVNVPALLKRFEKYPQDNYFVLTELMVAAVSKTFENGNGAFHTCTDNEMALKDDFEFSGLSLMVPTPQGKWGEGAKFWSAYTVYMDRRKKTLKATSRFLDVTVPVVAEDDPVEGEEKAAEGGMPEGSEPSDAELSELYKLT